MRPLIKPSSLILLLFVSLHAFANSASEKDGTFEAKGLFALDYELIPVPGDKSIDLLGFHYLHELNDWFYLGAGLHAPLFRGNYGGFMAFDVTAHVRKNLTNNVFFNAGLSLGGGGGGSDIEQSKLLSGEGGFIKHYAGLAYHFPRFAVGLGYSHFRFFNSLIDSTQVNFFIQKPISFLAGSYLTRSGAGFKPKQTLCETTCTHTPKIKVAADIAHLQQISPQGIYKDNMELLSIQYSYFMNDNAYVFIGGDAGVRGLPLYNQVLGGLGYQIDLSKRFNLSGQVGIGSGGYAPSEIDTGPGLLAYPKVGLEYLVNNKIGVTLTAGYLAALKGSSKNTTVGLGLSYYLAGNGAQLEQSASDKTSNKKVRANLYHQTKFDLNINDERLGDLHMITAQFDYVFNDHWYVPTQLAFAYDEYHGYPGYGEILLGLGVQSQATPSSRFQVFFQTLVGSNIGGGMVKPELGLNLGVSDQIAIYGQAGITRSLGSLNRHTLSSYHLGLGLTYRFSILE